MAAAQGDDSFIVRVLADFFYLVKGRAGGYEVEGTAFYALQRFPAEGQAEAVHADHCEAVLSDFKEGAGMDGTGLVG